MSSVYKKKTRIWYDEKSQFDALRQSVLAGGGQIKSIDDPHDGFRGCCDVAFNDPLDPVDLARKLGIEHPDKQPPTEWHSEWKLKYLDIDSTSIDGMIVSFQRFADILREMKAAGVFIDHDEGDQDHIVLATNDPVVARRFGFQPPWWWELDDEA